MSRGRPSGKIINDAPERKPDYMPSDNRTPLTASNDDVEHGNMTTPPMPTATDAAL